MNPKILKYCLEKGLLLDKEVYNILSELGEENAKELIEEISESKEKIITKSFLVNSEKLKENEQLFEKLRINLGLSIEISRQIIKKPEKAEQEKEERRVRNVKVIYSAANYTKKLEVEDFVKYFRSRLVELRKILQERKELENLVSINKINGQRQSLSIIGVVYDKRVTKNKNIIIGMEDLTGRISVLVNCNKPEAYEKAKDIVLDSVIGIRGVGNRDIIFVNEVVYPDSFLTEKNSLSRDESIAFISDIHTGSKMFLEKNFEKFIDWLNGNIGEENQKEDARKVKYLFITGDTVDGIGVYPGQENMLNIKSVKEQYVKLADFLGRIRKDVTIILCPGQHDAVRIAEPQPALNKEYSFPLHEMENLILVSNPALIEIVNNGGRGIRVLMYHGASMTHLINEVDSLRIINAHFTPSKVVRYMLKIRHLSPMHSFVTYIPNEKTDDLAIKEVPDIIATGELHRADIDIYNNILIITSSCWQSITPFEEKVGNHPDPCKVPILNLKTRQVKILDFSELGEDKTCQEQGEKIVCEIKK